MTKTSGVLIAIAGCAIVSSGMHVSADDWPDNVAAAFAAISAESHTVRFERGKIRVPSGGHLQGVQLRDDPDNDRVLAFLSHDSQTIAYILVVAFPSQLTEPGEIIHVHRFPQDGLRHAGGIQLLGNMLAVGLEDNRAKHRSEVQFWDVSEPTDWSPLRHLTIERQGLPEDQTAGAVAVANHDGRIIVAVANGDSRAIDFYRSNGRDPHDFQCRLSLLTRWSAAAADRSTWQPDGEPGSYQAINFIPQANGELYMTGFCVDGGVRDTVDLFRVLLSQNSRTVLTRVNRRQIALTKGNSFHFAGGLWTRGNKMSILAAPRRIFGEVHIDILEAAVDE